MARTRNSSVRANINWHKLASALKSAASTSTTQLANRLAQQAFQRAGSYAADKVSQSANQFVSYGKRKAKEVLDSYTQPAKRVRRPGGRSRYRTTGRSGPKFSKKGTSKVSKFLKSGCNLKCEFGYEQEDAEAVYVGHYALPVDRVPAAVMYAIARRILNKMGFFPTDLVEGVLDQDLDVTWQFRSSFNGTVASTTPLTVSASPAISVAKLGDAIGANLLTAIPNNIVYFEAVGLSIEYTTSLEKVFHCSADAMMVEFDCVSNLQIQNRTKASGVGDETSALDITNNPLRGKQYMGFYNLHPYRFNNDTSVAIPSLGYTNGNGALYVGASNSEFTTDMSNLMKKPPPRSAFGNVVKNSYVQIAPGEIRRSKIRTHKKMSFNNFVKLYLDAFRGATVIYTLNEALVRAGKACFFGFEKMCDSGSESANVAIGAEWASSVNAIVYIKKKNFMNPYNIFS